MLRVCRKVVLNLGMIEGNLRRGSHFSRKRCTLEQQARQESPKPLTGKQIQSLLTELYKALTTTHSLDSFTILLCKFQDASDVH